MDITFGFQFVGGDSALNINAYSLVGLGGAMALVGVEVVNFVNGNSTSFTLPTLSLGSSGNTPQYIVLMLVPATPPVSTSITVVYSYSVVTPSNLMMILGYCVGGLFIAVTVGMVIYCYYKRRRIEREMEERERGRGPKEFELSHFDRLMPVCPMTGEIRNVAQTCSICLNEFDYSSMLRVTPCNHYFHQ